MKTHIFCDFDGTITNEDSLVVVLDAFGDPKWRAFEQALATGKSTPMETLVKETESLHAPMSEMLALLDKTVSVRKGFSRFISETEKLRIPFTIVSGGYFTFISHILRAHGYDNLLSHVITNDIVPSSSASTQWTLLPNNGPKRYPDYPTCKAFPIREAKKSGHTTVYIGDGNTDYMAARESDIVFARATLAKFMRKEGLSFIPYETFDDITKHLFAHGEHTV